MIGFGTRKIPISMLGNVEEFLPVVFICLQLLATVGNTPLSSTNNRAVFGVLLCTGQYYS